MLSYLPEVRPSWFFAVPRIWEKLKAGLETMLASQPEEQREDVERALEAVAAQGAPRAGAARRSRRSSPSRSSAPTRRSSPGCARCSASTRSRRSTSAPRPTPVEVLEFFHAIGLPLAELWGMSETCGAGTRQPARTRSASARSARPRRACEIKLDSDGEVLIRSDVVMKGYRNLPEKTAEAFTEDGFLRTGDIGEFDEEGYLKIVDRKKELIISAARQEHVARRTSRRR